MQVVHVSNGLEYEERTDIKFNFPNCEACFVEVECKNPVNNHIFGALYRHPNYYAKTFNNHLGDFLENFTARGKTLTILGDINVDLNKSNVASNEYINTLNSAGFSTLINQPTRIFHYEGSNYVAAQP